MNIVNILHTAFSNKNCDKNLLSLKYLTELLSTFQKRENLLKRYKDPIIDHNNISKGITIKSINKESFVFVFDPIYSYEAERMHYTKFDEEYFKKAKMRIPTARHNSEEKSLLINKSNGYDFLDLMHNLCSQRLIKSRVGGVPDFIWHTSILNKGREEWDFEILQSLDIIRWSKEQISTFNDKVDWAYLSGNYDSWGIQLINQFYEYIVFNNNGRAMNNSYKFPNPDQNFSLSSNNRMSWEPNLIDTFADKWDWRQLSENKAIKWTETLINRHKNRICFQSLCRNESVDWTESLIDKYMSQINFNELVKNSSITWDIHLLLRYEKYIDFALLAKHGKISFEAIIYFENIWDSIDKERMYGKRNSDGGYFYNVDHTLWEYLCQNPNIEINDTFISKFLNKIPTHLLSKRDDVKISSDFISAFWDFKKNERTRYWENYDGDEFEEFKNIRLLEQLIDAEIVDLTLDIFKENEIKWWGLFNSDIFLNKSILSLLLQQESSQNHLNT